MISLDKNEVNKSNIFQAKNLEFYKHRNVIKGKNNTVNINPDKVNIKKMNLKIIGSNNQIIIKDNCKLNIESIHLVGDNHILEIGSECRLTGKIAIKGEKNFIKIGNKTSFQKAYLLADESKSITIGEDCMFSSEVMLRTSDAHSIIDLNSGKRKNPPQEIKLGNHVWLGMRAIITKGVEIADNCVIATTSVVTKNFLKPNCTIGGVPAKILSENINWLREKI